MNDWETDILQERYELARERLGEIPEEKALPGEIGRYFLTVACYLRTVLEKKEISEIGEEEYEHSYVNPVFAVMRLGADNGRLLSFLYYEMKSLPPLVEAGTILDAVIRTELFLEVYGAFLCEWQEKQKSPDYESIRRIIYWYAFDYADIAAEQYIRELSSDALDGKGSENGVYLVSHSILYHFEERDSGASQEADMGRPERISREDWDHRNDVDLIRDKAYVSRRQEVLRTAMEKYGRRQSNLLPDIEL